MRVIYLGDALKASSDNNDSNDDDRLCDKCNFPKEYYTTEKIMSVGSQELNHCIYHLMLEIQELREQLRKLQGSSN